jgi:hypothetical protein
MRTLDCTIGFVAGFGVGGRACGARLTGDRAALEST